MFFLSGLKFKKILLKFYFSRILEFEENFSLNYYSTSFIRAKLFFLNITLLFVDEHEMT